MAATDTATGATFADEIPREKLMGFVRELGFDPAETLSIVWESDEVTVTTYHLDPEHGRRSAAPGGPGAPFGAVTITTKFKVIG